MSFKFIFTTAFNKLLRNLKLNNRLEQRNQVHKAQYVKICIVRIHW